MTAEQEQPQKVQPAKQSSSTPIDQVERPVQNKFIEIQPPRSKADPRIKASFPFAAPLSVEPEKSETTTPEEKPAETQTQKDD